MVAQTGRIFGTVPGTLNRLIDDVLSGEPDGGGELVLPGDSGVAHLIFGRRSFQPLATRRVFLTWRHINGVTRGKRRSACVEVHVENPE